MSLRDLNRLIYTEKVAKKVELLPIDADSEERRHNLIRDVPVRGADTMIEGLKNGTLSSNLKFSYLGFGIHGFAFGVDGEGFNAAIKLYYGSVDSEIIKLILGRMEIPSEKFEPARWREEQVLKKFNGRKVGDSDVPGFVVSDVLGKHIGHRIDDSVEDVEFLLTVAGVIVGHGSNLIIGKPIMMGELESTMPERDEHALRDQGVVVDWHSHARNAISTSDGRVHIIEASIQNIEVINEVLDYWRKV